MEEKVNSEEGGGKKYRPSNYLDEKPVKIDFNEISISGEKVIDLLKEEYYFLQSTIEEYDKKAITIKAWSITFSLAVLATALASHEIHDLSLLSCVSAVLFWIIEGYWRIFQQSFYRRSLDIEMFLNGKKMEKFRVVNVMGSFNYNLKYLLKKNWWSTFFKPQTCLPYILISIVTLIMWLATMQ
ncbi:MAG: hypothetical protein GYB31_05690 [Bacteroidetes bacterium]|nr:hypothetical protein [Bacteroidota bacterium]